MIRREIEDIKMTQMELPEIQNTIIEIKIHWMGKIC